MGKLDDSKSVFWQIVDVTNYQYFMDKVKAPFMKAIIHFAKKYPTPTFENCYSPQSHKLIKIRDEFLDREINTKRIPLFEAAWNILICEYEHDIYYRRRLDWLVGKINEYGWEALDGPPDSYPHEHCWKSEEPKEPNWKELMEERSNAISSRRSE